MDYVLYKGHVEEGYWLLTDGGRRIVPMSMSTKKAHKLAARLERNERIINWLVDHDWLAIIFWVVVVGLYLWWGM